MSSARIEKYHYMFKMSVSKEMQYRANFLAGMVTSVIPMGMSVFMWKAVYQEMDGAYGYNYTQIILYTILAAIISNLVSADFASDIASDIKTGELNKFLSQPIGYLMYRFLYYLGGKLISLSINGIMLIGVLCWFDRYTKVHIGLLNLIFFVVVTGLAILLNYAIFLIVGLTAFWLVDTFYLFWAINLIILLASGGILPLEVYGTVGKVLFRFLPFQYTTYIPIHIILGTLSFSEMIQSIGIQLLWIGVLGYIAYYLWRKGIKNYVSVGG